MKVTIKDVAKKSGVSIATVSLVLHGNPRISSETRKRVLKAVEELDYQPSMLARGLVMRQTGNIGFVLTEDHFLRTEPFYTRIFLGTEFGARDSNHFVLLATIPTDFSESDFLPRFITQKNVDGLIIAGKVPDTFLAKVARYHLPTVFVDFYPARGEHSAILMDNIRGGMLATEHLIQLGHRDIAFLAGDMAHPSIRERYLGYHSALQQHGISPNPELEIIDEKKTGKESGYHAVCTLLNKGVKFSALFACNDAMAIGAMECLKKQGYKIPEQISVVGFDDIESDAFQDPPLTTISVPKYDMGIEAIKLVREMIEQNLKKNKKIIVPVELIVRKSTAALIEN